MGGSLFCSASALSGSVTLHSVRLLRSRFGKTSDKRRVITREHEVKLLTNVACAEKAPTAHAAL